MTAVLTFAQTCAELQVGEHVLRSLIASGSLRAGKIGSTWRIRRDDLNAYLEAMTCPSISAATSGGTTSPSKASGSGGPRARGRKRSPSNSNGANTTPRSWEIYINPSR
ncbi:DNA-binding protein [Brevundimonas intermedia]|uniref:DNA-binding protein n=1 Tax=Brevundimonas intermedia TaxID=74315 RepID=A0A4Y9S313_9CAUL|nr:DNA-binding protein [Brevundimonas intermedia]